MQSETGSDWTIPPKRTPYILNAIDVASRLVIGQLAIREKTNEMAAIPVLAEMIEMEGGTVTIDAISATENIMNAIHNNGGEFVLQVKRNCPALYAELMKLFDGLSKDWETDEEEFQNKYDDHYSEVMVSEKQCLFSITFLSHEKDIL